MKLFKSIFWLSVAYLAIGPQVNAVDAVGEFSRQSVTGSSQLIARQMDRIDCADLTCMGGKMAVASTLNMLPTAPEPANADLVPSDDIPFPRPRLDRT